MRSPLEVIDSLSICVRARTELRNLCWLRGERAASAAANSSITKQRSAKLPVYNRELSIRLHLPALREIKRESAAQTHASRSAAAPKSKRYFICAFSYILMVRDGNRRKTKLVCKAHSLTEMRLSALHLLRREHHPVFPLSRTYIHTLCARGDNDRVQ